MTLEVRPAPRASKEISTMYNLFDEKLPALAGSKPRVQAGGMLAELTECAQKSRWHCCRSRTPPQLMASRSQTESPRRQRDQGCLAAH